jgi:hypothetical protein
MRLNVSDTFLMKARAAARTVQVKVSIKKTNSRSEALSTGTWEDVTDYLSIKQFPTFKNSVEINLSQFSASTIGLTALGIVFWETNYFSYANFLELKIEYILSGLTGEPVPVFSGWIEKTKGKFNYKRGELPNTLTFNVWSYADYADSIWASSLLAQYVDDDIDGSGTDGLTLPHISGLFVTNANVASYQLKKGVHIIAYQVTDVPTKQAKLDDGDWVTITGTGSFTLVNKIGDQKVTLYARTVDLPASGDLQDDIIVDTPGDTFPKNWFSSINAQFLAAQLFSKAGITSLSLDTFEYDTADGGKKLSFLDVVPNDLTQNKYRDAIASDGTYLWCGVANKLYQRNMNTSVYALKQTLAAGANIRKLIYNSGHGHLWIFCSNGYLYRYTVGTDTLSAVIDLTSDVYHGTVVVLDYGGLYYVLYNNHATAKIHGVDGASLSDTVIGTGTGYYLGGAFIPPSTTQYWYQNGGGYSRWTIDSPLSHSTDDGIVLTLTYAYDEFAFHPTESRVYFFDVASRQLSSHTLSSGTKTNIAILNNIGGNYDNNVWPYYSAADGAVFIATSGKVLYRIASNTATQVGTGVQNKYFTFCDHNSRLYGEDTLGRLYQYATVVALYIDAADFEGMTVRAAIEKLCLSFNLLYKISSTKSARIQRRSNSAGVLITSGNSVSLTADNLKDISDDSPYGEAYDIINIKNANNEVNYDGSVFDAVAFDKERVLPINSDWIPNEILNDLAFNLYQFFSVSHTVYTCPSPAALIHYECLDGALVVYSGKMDLNFTGLIIDDAVDNAGRPTFKIVANS